MEGEQRSSRGSCAASRGFLAPWRPVKRGDRLVAQHDGDVRCRARAPPRCAGLGRRRASRPFAAAPQRGRRAASTASTSASVAVAGHTSSRRLRRLEWRSRRPHVDVVEAGQLRHQRCRLRDQRRAVREPVVERVEKRRLADAGPPNEGDPLADGDAEADLRENGTSGVADGLSLEGDQRRQGCAHSLAQFLPRFALRHRAEGRRVMPRGSPPPCGEGVGGGGHAVLLGKR